MYKTPSISNSDIEYLDKVWNFTSGCGKGCPYCYAKKITKRFTNHYPNEFAPTLYPEALLSPLYLKKPSRIGVCYMGDLFWDCPEFDPERQVLFEDGYNSLRQILFFIIRACPQHTFIFLTKQPQNLRKFSPFPDNCWVGVSVTDFSDLYYAVQHLYNIEAKVKYLSAEPLLASLAGDSLVLSTQFVDWVIIGSQTKPTVMPKIEWVREIVEAADKAGIPVFLKDSLLELVNYHSPETEFAFNAASEYRQEMPDVTG